MRASIFNRFKLDDHNHGSNVIFTLETTATMASRRAVAAVKIFRPSQYLQTRLYTASALRAYENPKTALHKREAGGIHPDELEQLLAEPTWSVKSLLPPKERAPDAPKISSQQLHHLLRLSALPPPESHEEEQKMLDILAAQLHFVGKIQEVDTTGVKPLRAIRDETAAAEEEQTITYANMKRALDKEKSIGRYHRRIERDTTPVDAKDVEDWDVLGSAERKSGQYFVVESERPQE
jgi:Asp-tRNA(Asn)/Glu-tRNA(Gln) amidotransferase C subunit